MVSIISVELHNLRWNFYEIHLLLFLFWKFILCVYHNQVLVFIYVYIIKWKRLVQNVVLYRVQTLSSATNAPSQILYE